MATYWFVYLINSIVNAFLFDFCGLSLWRCCVNMSFKDNRCSAVSFWVSKTADGAVVLLRGFDSWRSICLFFKCNVNLNWYFGNIIKEWVARKSEWLERVSDSKEWVTRISKWLGFGFHFMNMHCHYAAMLLLSWLAFVNTSSEISGQWCLKLPCWSRWLEACVEDSDLSRCSFDGRCAQ